MPGKQLATALSWDPVAQLPVTPAIDKVELYFLEALRAISPTFPDLLGDFRADQAADRECAQLRLLASKGGLGRIPTAPLLRGYPHAADIHRRNSAQRRAQRLDFDHRHAAQDLRPLGEGERVQIRDADCAGTVLSPAQRPRSCRGSDRCRHLVPQQSPSSDGRGLGSSSPLPHGSQSPPQTQLGCVQQSNSQGSYSSTSFMDTGCHCYSLKTACI
ncbi:hypothetical protein HPB50_023325 [Hyalomma asiaticum]|uniref:Uncharacterized protein n=1 Tax=Hyalomma asiaticum TaxID=266040 RepID=A0ACB7TM81_HYAAI|nr:hypothetical protein HPB50_023325 [Hyalomma asiaticum]